MNKELIHLTLKEPAQGMKMAARSQLLSYLKWFHKFIMKNVRLLKNLLKKKLIY